jgi:hypothetical protein
MFKLYKLSKLLDKANNRLLLHEVINFSFLSNRFDQK